MFTKVEQELGRKIPQALKKLSGGKWVWRPKIGDLWLDLDGEVHCIGDELYLEHIQSIKELAKAIPLLHWEEIKRILEEIGYWVNVREFKKYFQCEIFREYKNDFVLDQNGRTFQEAVQRATLGLAGG